VDGCVWRGFLEEGGGDIWGCHCDRMDREKKGKCV
jgi:hypothetical protein